MNIHRIPFRTTITIGSIEIGINLNLDGDKIDIDFERDDGGEIYGIYLDEKEWNLINEEIDKLKGDAKNHE